MIKILIVVPYLELQQAFEEVIHTFDLQDLSVSTTHIFGTDPQVIEPLNADIIVARGITASAIALQKPSVHVVPSTGQFRFALPLPRQNRLSQRLYPPDHQ